MIPEARRELKGYGKGRHGNDVQTAWKCSNCSDSHLRIIFTSRETIHYYIQCAALSNIQSKCSHSQSLHFLWSDFHKERQCREAEILRQKRERGREGDEEMFWEEVSQVLRRFKGTERMDISIGVERSRILCTQCGRYK